MVNDLDIQTENDKTHMHLNFNLILISSKRSCRYNSYWALGSMVLNTTFNSKEVPRGGFEFAHNFSVCICHAFVILVLIHVLKTILVTKE
jgi:hypothetical protein